jgi:hypothetical protein
MEMSGPDYVLQPTIIQYLLDSIEESAEELLITMGPKQWKQLADAIDNKNEMKSRATLENQMDQYRDTVNKILKSESSMSKLKHKYAY